jgi:hypothetical protein
MIVEPPHKQCATVQKLGLNVKKLEEVTMETMSIWFNDKDHPENATKRPFLREIFKIAKAEERYKNGEIGKLRLQMSFDLNLQILRRYYLLSGYVRRQKWTRWLRR